MSFPHQVSHIISEGFRVCCVALPTTNSLLSHVTSKLVGSLWVVPYNQKHILLGSKVSLTG